MRQYSKPKSQSFVDACFTILFFVFGVWVLSAIGIINLHLGEFAWILNLVK